LYYVLKQRRPRSRINANTETWQPVSLYDSEDYFRGQAIFETEREAQAYLLKYNARIIFQLKKLKKIEMN
jgi:hypothetical protein